MSPNEYRELATVRDALNDARSREDWEAIDRATARLAALLASRIGHKSC